MKKTIVRLLSRYALILLFLSNVGLAISNFHGCYLALLQITENPLPAIEAIRIKLDGILQQSDLDSDALVETLNSVPEIAQLFSAYSGRLSIRVHTKLVLEQYKAQASYLKKPLESLNTSMNVEKFMRLLLAVHDLGKGLAMVSGNSGKQEEYNPPLAQKLFLGLGFSEKEANLAKALLSTDALGELAQGKIDEQKAQEALTLASQHTGLTPQQFYHLQMALFTADASSYTKFRRSSFIEKGGELLPKSQTFQKLSMLISGVQPPPKLYGKSRMLALGFDSSVASKVLKEFPEVVQRIEDTPDNSEAPWNYSFPYFTKFADGKPITLYRRINIPWSEFDSKKTNTKHGVSYTTTSLSDALGRGGAPQAAADQKGLVFEMQVPRFFVRRKKGFPVLDIKEMKDLAPYIRRVGIIKRTDSSTNEEVIDWKSYEKMPNQ